MEVPEGDVLKVLGLLELLSDYNGRIAVDDIRDLTGLEFEHLKPTIETAELLGLVDIDGRFVELTSKGSRLLKKDPEDRKAYLGKIITNISVFKEIKKLLQKKGSISLEELENFLEKSGSLPSGELTLKNIISWGTYAELFHLDHHTNRIVVEKE